MRLSSRYSHSHFSGFFLLFYFNKSPLHRAFPSRPAQLFVSRSKLGNGQQREQTNKQTSIKVKPGMKSFFSPRITALVIDCYCYSCSGAMKIDIPIRSNSLTYDLLLSKSMFYFYVEKCSIFYFIGLV